MTERQPQTQCLNCHTKYRGAFCPKCGQKASTARLQVKEVCWNTIESMLGGDSKWLTTCRGLLVRPGHMVHEYLLGKRAAYYAPVQLLLSLTAIYAIATYAMADTVSPFDILRLDLKEDDVATNSAQSFVLYYQAITGNKVYFALISILLNLLPYRLLFGRCGILRPDGKVIPLNIAEHFCTLTYQACFNMLLAFAILPFGLIADSEKWLSQLCFVMPTVYCIVLYKQLCGISWFKSILLNFLCIIFAMAISMAVLLLIFGILYGYDYAQ